MSSHVCEQASLFFASSNYGNFTCTNVLDWLISFLTHFLFHLFVRLIYSVVCSFQRLLVCLSLCFQFVYLFCMFVFYRNKRRHYTKKERNKQTSKPRKTEGTNFVFWGVSQICLIILNSSAYCSIFSFRYAIQFTRSRLVVSHCLFLLNSFKLADNCFKPYTLQALQSGYR